MKSKLLVLILILFLIPSYSSAVQFVGGKSLFYTQIAQGYATGQLGFAFYTRIYAKPITERDIRNNQVVLCANYGVAKHWELSLTQIVYQDICFNLLEGGETSQLPGYTQIRIKTSNYNFKIGEKIFFFGFQGSVTKQSKYYNIYLEPYYDYGVAGRFCMLFSYYTNPFYPEESSAIHFNVGYTNYNDAEKIVDSGQSIPVSIGYVRSNLKTEYSLEMHGDFFVTRPYISAFSRENYLYICPGFKYKIFLGLAIGAAVDVKLYSEDELTTNKFAPFSNDEYPQYPAWRLNLKLDYIPSTGFYEIDTFGKIDKASVTKESLRSRRIITDKKSLFEWVIDENMGAEYIDLELEKIRRERKEAEKELEKLKKEIEEKSGK